MCYHMCMQIYTFSSVIGPAVIYYTFDPTGDNLPYLLAPWRDISHETELLFSDQMAQVMQRDGYYRVPDPWKVRCWMGGLGKDSEPNADV